MNNFINSIARNGLSKNAYLFGLVSTFLVSPFVSLWFIIYGMRRNERNAYIVFAVFMALMAYMLAPISDLASYGFSYYRYQNLSWDQFANRYLSGDDFIMQTIEWGFSQSGIPFAFMRFLQTLIAFNFLNAIFFYKIDHSENAYSDKEIFYRYICYILVFPFVLMVGGVRFGFGVVIMLYGFHLYIDRNKLIPCIVVLLLASWIHFALFYYSLLTFAFLHLNIHKKYLIAILLVVFIVSLPIQSYVEAYFVKNEIRGGGYLGDGVWGRQLGMTLGIKALVYHWGQRLLLLPLLYAFYVNYDSKDKWLRLFFSYLVLFASTYSAFALVQRTTVCLTTCSLFIYLSLENIGSKFSVKLNGLMVICAVLICSFDLFTHRKQIILSDYWRIAQPAVYTFTQDYNMTWLFDNAGDRKGSLNN